jgi:hypothetical protein
MARIDLVLTDDWELRGDGSGHMPRLQFDTMERLLAVYERHGLVATFTVEVMQQLRHLEEGARRPDLAGLARRWEDLVRGAYRRGHDVQLHLHPQWDGATWDGGRWRLTAPWSILDHPPERVRALVRAGREYLEGLLRPLDAGYRCVAFRGGSWCIAPGAHVLPALIDNGILLDVSLVGGIRYDNAVVRLDYRHLDEDFLPFYPDPRDARRVAAGRQPIVCLPTHTFEYGPAAKIRHLVLRRAARLPGAGRLLGPWRSWEAPDSVPVAGGGADHYTIWRQGGAGRGGETSGGGTAGDGSGAGNRNGGGNGAGAGNGAGGRLRRWIAYYRQRDRLISSLASLSFPMMREMLRDIRRRAAASGWEAVPVVLENHTKDLGLFEPIERFAAHLARQPDIKVVTLGQVARDLAAGRYPVLAKKAAA